MIGGRVVDTSAVLGFARQQSVYMAAVLWTATEEDIVLLLPATVLAAATAVLDDAGRDVLRVLVDLPVVVVDGLDAERARAAGAVGLGDVPAAHAALCAAERGWPLITAEPGRYAASTDLGLEVLP